MIMENGTVYTPQQIIPGGVVLVDDHHTGSFGRSVAVFTWSVCHAFVSVAMSPSAFRGIGHKAQLKRIWG
jgi:hypothetical protein